MSQLQALELELKDLLFVGGKKPARSRFFGAVLPPRLNVYKNNMRLNWTDTLDSDFPLTQKQFSAAEWTTLSEKFFSKHPPVHWELNTSVASFVSFLKKQKLPLYIKELAEYEWTDLTTFLHPSSLTANKGITNPTVAVRVFQHQIFYWVGNEASPKKFPQRKPEALVFYRDSKFGVNIEEIDPLALLMLEHFRKPGAKLADLEHVRTKILPNNRVQLDKILSALKAKELIL